MRGALQTVSDKPATRPFSEASDFRNQRLERLPALSKHHNTQIIFILGTGGRFVLFSRHLDRAVSLLAGDVIHKGAQQGCSFCPHLMSS